MTVQAPEAETRWVEYGERWRLRQEVGHHDDVLGRPWERWTAYLDGVAVFISPSQELAVEGMEDWARSGHGPAVPIPGTCQEPNCDGELHFTGAKDPVTNEDAEAGPCPEWS
jgi:hypothetical protein